LKIAEDLDEELRYLPRVEEMTAADCSDDNTGAVRGLSSRGRELSLAISQEQCLKAL
jgi:hypothetical protein